MGEMTRRQFVGAAVAAAGAAHPLSASIARAVSLAPDGSTVQTSRRLTDGWELFQGSLAGPWEVWHSEELAAFAPVTMPHCFNAYDGCDPDVSYYRGQGWYRTRLKLENPFKSGRTLLHFLGCGAGDDGMGRRDAGRLPRGWVRRVCVRYYGCRCSAEARREGCAADGMLR